MNALLIVLAFAAAPDTADNIDRLFEKAAALEKTGDCTGAQDVYTDITGLTSTLPVADKKRIDSQVKSRQARNKGCVDACAISDKDKRMFETAKQAQQDGELKRVAEMCKVILHSKNAKCTTYNDIRSFCPTLGENGDPCGVSPETAAELEAIKKDVDALEKKAGRAAYAVKTDNPKGIDAVSSANRELDAAYERIFDLREHYFACDKVYGGLKMSAGTLGKSRNTLRVALAKAYKSKLSKFEDDLAALQKSKEEVDAKVDKLTQFTNDVALDVMSLAQTESIRSSVKIEGVAQNNAEQLAKVLQGDRLAMEEMIKKNGDYFEGQGRAGLMRKKDALERLDQVLAKLGDQGYGERLGFKTAQQEVKATLALVTKVIPPESEAHASQTPWVPIFAGVGCLLAIGAVLILRSKRGGSDTPPRATTSLSLGKRPLGAPAPKTVAPAAVKPTAATAAPVAASATPPAAPKTTPSPAPRRGTIKLGSSGHKRPAAKLSSSSKAVPDTEQRGPSSGFTPIEDAATLVSETTEPGDAPPPLAASIKEEPKALPTPPAPAAPPGPPKAPQQRPGIKLLSRR